MSILESARFTKAELLLHLYVNLIPKHCKRKELSHVWPFNSVNIINAIKLYNPNWWEITTFFRKKSLLADCAIIELLFYST